MLAPALPGERASSAAVEPDPALSDLRLMRAAANVMMGRVAAAQPDLGAMRGEGRQTGGERAGEA